MAYAMLRIFGDFVEIMLVSLNDAPNIKIIGRGLYRSFHLTKLNTYDLV